VGELPPGAQRTTVFAAGIPTTSRHPEMAKALIRWLASPLAYSAIRNSGLEPAQAPAEHLRWSDETSSRITARCGFGARTNW